jgi:hypothetical protein
MTNKKTASTSKSIEVTKITPILVVDRIEPLLPFWVDQLGFAKVVEVPHEGRLGFVLLAKGDGAQLMLQTKDSLAVDVPAVAKTSPATLLYADVASLAPVKSMEAEVLIPERKTFYGAKEIWIRDPAGRIIAFSEHA